MATHPIQYFAPFFRDLAARADVELMVFFAHRPNAAHQGEGFGVAFEWDIDVTGGYPHQFLENVAKVPAGGFRGYDCPEIGKLLVAGQFDFVVLQGWGWKCFWQAAAACRRAGIPYGVRSDSQLPQGKTGWSSLIKQRIRRMVYPLFISRIPLCLPYGERSAEYFRCYGARKIGIAPHCIDNAFFSGEAAKALPERGPWRQKFGVPGNAICFLFCGKFIPKKRPSDVIAAFAKLLKDSEVPVHLLMVGSGELEDILKEQANSVGRGISFAGFMNQSAMPAVYTAADCLVLPSDSGETWGLVVNEAMACGLPAIVSDSCGCVPDLIRTGHSGYSYPEGEIRELSGRMKEMLVPGQAARMGEGARELLEGKFNVTYAAGLLCASIRKLLVPG